jgi:hypothetical protein
MSEPPTWRRWGRRVSFWVLIAGLGYLVVRILQAQPVEVQVDLHLGRARTGLIGARVLYLRGDDVLRSARFGFEKRPAPPVLSHRIRVPRGSMTLDIELRYRGDPPAGVPGERRGGTIRLQRPMVVAGEGAVSVYVED